MSKACSWHGTQLRRITNAAQLSLSLFLSFWQISEMDRSSWAVPSVIFGLLGLVLMVGNAVIVAALCRKRQTKQSTYVFLCNTSVADTLLGLGLSQQVLLEHLGPLCQASTALLVLGTGSSLGHLLCYNLDNVLALRQITRVQASLSPAACRHMTATTWLIWGGMGAAYLALAPSSYCEGLGHHPRAFLWTLFTLILASVGGLVGLHGGLLQLLQLPNRVQPSVAVVGGATGPGRTFRLSCFTRPAGALRQRQLLHCRRLRCLLSIVLLCYVLVWTPSLVASLLCLLGGPCNSPVQAMLCIGPSLHALLNMALFWVRNHRLRRSIAQSIHCCHHKKRRLC